MKKKLTRNSRFWLIWTLINLRIFLNSWFLRRIKIHIYFTSFYILPRRHTSRDYFRFTARSVPRQAWTLNPSLSYSSKKFSTNKTNSWVVFGSQISCRYYIQWCKYGYFREVLISRLFWWNVVKIKNAYLGLTKTIS